MTTRAAAKRLAALEKSLKTLSSPPATPIRKRASTSDQDIVQGRNAIKVKAEDKVESQLQNSWIHD